ncbi:AraC family transcriptional regulator [Streptomyces sp. TLI_171]|uniref:helix-turn-helix transcriptional regulator n=1 Tax=Streptomyces sp. TLI_171 TaxID=1938859 RepID=UPI000C18BF07|nr:AraC family transcriptional regulator [Streptomyces sp. TLI_171]RKE17085.1 AraC-like DNA-binding protein [Streptomyces sp. TLI_171]
MTAAPRQQITAWRPHVPGVVEVFHAHFTEHRYPMHVHDSWTLLIVDDGAVRYDLDRHRRGTPHDTVSLLPPHVPHNGSAATDGGFRKRVLYLEPDRIGEELIGAAVDGPDLADPLLRHRVGQLHTALGTPGEELEAESRLALISERLRGLLRPSTTAPDAPVGAPLAHDLRDLLDARLTERTTLDDAARHLHAHPAHLVRTFTTAFGLPPHQYLTARRIDRARHLLLDGHPATTVATTLGFHDQSHLTRHFRRIIGTTPGRYARGPSPAGAPGLR